MAWWLIFALRGPKDHGGRGRGSHAEKASPQTVYPLTLVGEKDMSAVICGGAAGSVVPAAHSRK